MTDHREIPMPGGIPITRVEQLEDFGRMIEKILEGVPLSFDQVERVLDLACGTGVMVAGALDAFPNAQIDAIDYHADALSKIIRENPRVHFHKGYIIDQLSQPDFPKVEIVTLSFGSDSLGFTAGNIHLLADHMTRYLITAGDNSYIQATPWFKKHFQWVKDDWHHNAQVWEKKTFS